VEAFMDYLGMINQFTVKANARTPLIFKEARGNYVLDSTGKEYLDLTAGQVCSIVGHCNPRLARKMADQAKKLVHIHSGFYSEEELELAKKIAEINSNSLRRSFFLNTGGEAVEVAMRLAKLVTGKFEFVSLERGWYGLSNACSALTGIPDYKKGVGPVPAGYIHIPAPDCYHCSYSMDKINCRAYCLESAQRSINASSTNQIAAFIVEPILAAGGIVIPPMAFFQGIKLLCQEYNALLIFDECQTGWGRTGSMFCYQHYGIVPDILVLGKGLGGGVPISAVVTTDEISEQAYRRGFKYITSHMCDPFVCAVANETIDIITQENLVEHALQTGKYFINKLNMLKETYELIGDVRGLGLMIGIEIVRDRVTKEPGFAEGHRIHEFALEQGLIMNIVIPHNIFRIVPPLTIGKAEVDKAIGILDSAFQKIRHTDVLKKGNTLYGTAY
jgi:2,2-dialkylglycine decarboxylase (pyruvate)